MIDPRALRTFHQVCQTGSISGAARSLNISQPSVSAAIAQLEGKASVGDTVAVIARGTVLVRRAS